MCKILWQSSWAAIETAAHPWVSLCFSGVGRGAVYFDLLVQGARWMGELCKAKSSPWALSGGQFAAFGAGPAIGVNCKMWERRGKNASPLPDPPLQPEEYSPLPCLAPRSIFLTASFPFFSTYLSTKCFPSFQTIFILFIRVISLGK